MKNIGSYVVRRIYEPVLFHIQSPGFGPPSSLCITKEMTDEQVGCTCSASKAGNRRGKEHTYVIHFIKTKNSSIHVDYRDCYNSVFLCAKRPQQITLSVRPYGCMHERPISFTVGSLSITLLLGALVIKDFSK